MNGSSCCQPRQPGRPSGGVPAPDCVAPATSLTAPAIAWCTVPAGRFTMGTDGNDAVPGDGEGPARPVDLPAFEVGAGSVSNEQFAAFVRATGYITDAERIGSSYVFHLQLTAAQRDQTRHAAVVGLPWWRRIDDACWQRPQGPGSSYRSHPGHPVVHVSWHDARAWCDWAGARLPSEAEWERAARGGLEGCRYPWGDDLLGADGAPRCNIFRGEFPDHAAAGWTPGPIDALSGPANGFGLFNACGNVWEWCADALDGPQRALRGGSFLCHDAYCRRYRVSARSGNTADASASNIGFRAVRSA